jgi:hypothetical protein
MRIWLGSILTMSMCERPKSVGTNERCCNCTQVMSHAKNLRGAITSLKTVAQVKFGSSGNLRNEQRAIFNELDREILNFFKASTELSALVTANATTSLFSTTTTIQLSSIYHMHVLVRVHYQV